MGYILSGEREHIKREREARIAQLEEEYLNLDKEIKKVRASKNGSMQDREFEILKLQIQQKEIERDLSSLEYSIICKCILEMKENLNERRKNKEISPLEYRNEKHNIEEYMDMINNCCNIDSYDIEDEIFELKQKLEYMKMNMGIVSKRQADENIKKMRETQEENKESRQEEAEELAKRNFEYKRRNLYYQRASGQISEDELKQKLGELEQTKGEIPTQKELEEIRNALFEKYLKKPQQLQEVDLVGAYKGATITEGDLNSAISRLRISGKREQPNKGTEAKGGE